jgi:folate-binding protein YgfZ
MPWSNASFTIAGVNVRLMRVPYLGHVDGYAIIVDPTASDSVRAALTRAGAIAGSETTWSIASLESGRPEWGRDLDANTIPQEANLDSWGAISFEKGCYTGQETVARIHFRGHVNRTLRGLMAETAMPLGAEVRDSNGKAVGGVRRSGRSPRLGNLAIAMLRREVSDGDAVLLGSGDGSIEAQVVPLPFAP